MCTNQNHAGGCRFGSLHADAVDEIVLEEMRKKLAEFKILSKNKGEGCSPQVVKLKSRIDTLEREIASLLDKVASANETVMKYINHRIAALDAEKKELCIQIAEFDEQRPDDAGEISGYLEYWEELSISDKITVVDVLIERITASKERLEIKWKI